MKVPIQRNVMNTKTKLIWGNHKSLPTLFTIISDVQAKRFSNYLKKIYNFFANP